MRRIRPGKAAAARVYLKLRREFLESRPSCERCQAARSEDVHHKAGRGLLLNDTSMWAALCRPCHRRVTEYPAEAYEQGWSVRRIGGDAA